MENLSEIARIQEAEREAIQEELERGGKRLEEIQVMEIEALTRQNEFSYRYWQYEQKLMVTLSHELEQIKSEFPSGHYKFLEEVRSNFDEMDEEWRRRSREEDRVSTGLKLFRSVFHSAGLADKNVGFPSSTRQPQIKAGEEVEEEGSKKNRKGERQRLRRQRKRALKRESRAGEYDNQQEDDISIGADLLRVYQRSPGPETTKPVIDHLLASIDRLRTRDPYIDDSHKGLSESLAKIAYKDDQVRRTAASTLSREELQQYSAAIFYLLDSLKLKSFASGHRRDRNGFEYLQWVWCLVGHIESFDHGYVHTTTRLNPQSARPGKDEALRSLRLSILKFRHNATLDSYQQTLEKTTFKNDWITDLRGLQESIQTLFILSK